jgi:hypothetical protein
LFKNDKKSTFTQDQRLDTEGPRNKFEYQISLLYGPCTRW